MNCRTQKNAVTFSNTGQASSILHDKKQMFKFKLQMEVTKTCTGLGGAQGSSPQDCDRLTCPIIKDTCSASPSVLPTGSLWFVRAFEGYSFKKRPASIQNNTRNTELS